MWENTDQMGYKKWNNWHKKKIETQNQYNHAYT